MPSSLAKKYPIPITLVTTELTMAGAEKCLVNLALGIDKQKFSPTVVSLFPPPPASRDNLVHKLASAKIPFHFLNMRRSVSFPVAIAKLRSILKKTDSQLVLSFLFHANVLAATATRWSHQIHVAGIRVADPSRKRHWMERVAGKKTERIVCVSQAVEEFSRTVARLPEEKLLTIPNGIDLNLVDANKPLSLEQVGLQPGRKAIAFLGRLHEQKGLVEFFKHAKRLLDSVPNHDLLLIGTGPLQEKLEAIAEEEKISQRVHFVGWQKKPLSLLLPSDLLILPSRWEGMPNVVIEAMACNKPVVAFSVEGISELLGNPASSNLQVCEQGDYEQLIAKITKIVGDSELMTDLGAKNRLKIEDNFTLSAMIQRYESLFLKLLNA